MDIDRGKISTANKLYNMIDSQYADIRSFEVSISTKEKEIERLRKIILESKEGIAKAYSEIKKLKQELKDL